MDGEKYTRVKLIRDFFGLSGLEAIKGIQSLTGEGRDQLGSAIARARGIPEADCDFVHVAY